jgi:hypothetical protein
MQTRVRSTGELEVKPFPPAPVSTPLFEIDPARIRIEPTPTPEVARLQPLMSRAVWRPYGRRLAFKVTHDSALLGIVFLTCPVIQMTARDEAFAKRRYPGMLPLPGKGQVDEQGRKRTEVLKHYAEMSICVGAQPISWYWNLGKLCAGLAATLKDEWYAHAWASEPRHVELFGITTTSLWGHAGGGGSGTQYNRVYRYLGETVGFGHAHISDETYHTMLGFMRARGAEVPSSKFGAGCNSRMRRILAYRKVSGDKDITLRHGQRRGVYYCPARPTAERARVIQEWYDRWGLPRYLRTRGRATPYQSGTDLPPGAT